MQNRIFGIDLLRSIILVFGPTIHASMLMDGAFGFEGLLSQSTWLRNIFYISNQLRMELFFLISGFFSSLLIAKKSESYFIFSRKQKVLIPTVFSLVSIVPITFLLIYFLQGKTDLDYAISYRHIWFLVALSIISLLACISPNKITKLSMYLAKFKNSKNIIAGLIPLILIVFLFEVMSRTSNYLLHPKLLQSLQLGPVLKFFGYYICGMAIYFWKESPRRAMITSGILMFALWYLLKCAYNVEYKWFFSITKPAITVIACLSIFYSFTGIKDPGITALNKISELAFPFYLLHLPLLIIISSAWFYLSGSKSDILYSIIVIPIDIAVTYYCAKLLIRSNFIRKSLGLTNLKYN